MFYISLLHKYETSLYKGDYSRGTFFEGSINVSSQEEVLNIFNRFKNEAVIELYKATDRYSSKTVSETLSRLEFQNKDIVHNFEGHMYQSGDHRFGQGFIYHDTKSNYRYYYWISLVNISK
jgi:hypothetical protein